MKLPSRLPLVIAATVLASTAALAAMSPAQKAVVEAQMATAAKADPNFKGFSAERGKAFFTGTHTGGKPDTPACTTCHTTDLTKEGKTRAGKPIEPMAASVNPKRYTDPAEVEKWFKRNCNDVLGRECTPTEKGDALTYLLSL